MTEQNPYTPYNPPLGYEQYPQPQSQAPENTVPVATQAPQQGDQPPYYPPPGYQPYQQSPLPQYPQPQPPQPPKTNKTVFIVLGIVGAFILGCCLMFVALYLIGTALPDDGTDTTLQSQETSNVMPPIDPYPGPSPAPMPTPAPTPTPAPLGSDSDFDSLKTRGNDEVGYVKIPESWVEYTGKASNLGAVFACTTDEAVKTTQYSNAAGDQIVTLYAIDTSKISAKEFESIVFMNLDTTGFKGVNRKADTIAGYPAFMAGGLTVENVALLCWCFEDDLGKTHYIALEAPPDASNRLLDIPQSFMLKWEG